jgi:hypothetical protein
VKAATLLTLVLLTGCATTRYSTAHCITKEQYEQLKKDKPGKIHSELNGQADHDIKPIAGRLVRVEAWGDGLLTILGGCIG